MQFLKKHKAEIFISAISFLVGFLFLTFSLTKIWQEKVFDLFFLKKTPPSDIIIVSIDDLSIKKLGGWPFKREYFAKVLDRLEKSKAVALDIIFSDRSSFGQTDDFLFDQKIRELESKNVRVIVPFQYDDRGLKIIPPIFITKNSGFANILVSNDGVVREVETQRSQGDQDRKSMAFLLSGKENFPDKKIRINYVGPDKTFPNIPFIDVYEGNLSKDFFKDKIVLLGVTSKDLHDFFQTPFGIMSGVEIQANATASIKNYSNFKTMPLWATSFIMLLFAISALYIVKKIKNIWAQIVFLSLIFLAVNFFSMFLFGKYILLPNLPINISFILSASGTIIFQYTQESKEKKKINQMFQYYLTPDVINELIKHPEKLSLGGQKKEMAIFFSDIRGFTTISESISPENLTLLLNEYLTAMTDVLILNNGVLDKYIGDAIMAFWGAPIPNENQAKDACMTAIMMSETLRKLNSNWKEKGISEISIGMGINLGDVVVGNMGSKKRFNYTIMGDEVNFASRLEGLNKNYGTECLVSQSVFEKIKDNKEFKTRELDKVLVKGKKEPKTIYELVTKNFNEIDICFENFSKGKKFYNRGDFTYAKKIFEENYNEYNDNVSKVFADRCEYLEKNHPKGEWNGIFEFKDK